MGGKGVDLIIFVLQIPLRKRQAGAEAELCQAQGKLRLVVL